MDLAWMTLAALLLVVVLSCTTRVNPGLIAMVLAWLIVAVAGPWLGATLDQKFVAEAFPAELFLTLLGVSLLFAQAEANGTLARVAGSAERLCGGRGGVTPLLFFSLALAIGTAGPGNIAAAGLIAPVAMAAARRVGVSPLVMALAVGHGAIATSVSPFSAAGVVANQKLAAIGIENVAWRLYAWNAGINALAALGGCLLLMAVARWRGLNRSGLLCDTAAAVAGIGGSPWRLPAAQGMTLGVIAGVIGAVLLLRAPIGMAAFAGAALVAICRLAGERETIARVPWGILLMVCGVSVLTALVEQSGGTALFARLIGQVSTPATVRPVLALVTGVVSIYSSTTGVVLPVFLPLVREVAAAQGDSNPLGLALAVLVGGNLVDMSPLSTIGALCLAATPPEVDRGVLYRQLFAWGLAMALLGAVAAAICF